MAHPTTSPSTSATWANAAGSRPTGKSASTELRLRRVDLVQRLLVLGELADEPEDDRHVGGDGRADAGGGGRHTRHPTHAHHNGTHDHHASDRHLAHGHGRRSRRRGRPDRRGVRLHRGPQGLGPDLPRADQQLDLHAARPAGPVAAQRDRRPRGRHLDLRPRHRRLPRRAAPRRDGLRRRRGRPHERAARRRLRHERPRPRLRRARRDAHLLLRGDHQGDPAHRRRRPVHRDEPRSQRSERRGPAPRHGLGRRPHQHRDRTPALLHRQAQPADDAQRPEPARGALRDHRHGRRPDGHRHHQRPGGRPAHRARLHRVPPVPSRSSTSPTARPASSTRSPTSCPSWAELSEDGV